MTPVFCLAVLVSNTTARQVSFFSNSRAGLARSPTMFNRRLVGYLRCRYTIHQLVEGPKDPRPNFECRRRPQTPAGAEG